MPIIEVMKARGVVNCAVVVTRYFGGILLGAGGLVRAYAQGSKTALDAAGVVVMEKSARQLVEVDYSTWQRLEYFLRSAPVIIEHTEFGASVVCTLMVRVADEENPAGGYHPRHRRQGRNAGRRHAVLSVAGLRGHKMSGKYLLDAPDYIVI